MLLAVPQASKTRVHWQHTILKHLLIHTYHALQA